MKMADIKLVIKIPEEIYKSSQILDVKHEDVIQIPLEVIANGTPLPKGHGRLIDADALTYRQTHHGNYYTPFELIDRNRLNNAPTIIEADNEEKEDV